MIDSEKSQLNNQLQELKSYKDNSQSLQGLTEFTEDLKAQYEQAKQVIYLQEKDLEKLSQTLEQLMKDNEDLLKKKDSQKQIIKNLKETNSSLSQTIIK